MIEADWLAYEDARWDLGLERPNPDPGRFTSISIDGFNSTHDCLEGRWWLLLSPSTEWMRAILTSLSGCDGREIGGEG